jgi:pyruvate/2-oxoglutarate dehydrogenase complex dihydrolipoamide acyltransferase (E2) component
MTAVAKNRLVPLLAALALAAAAAPAGFADGDPASDYLISLPMFLPLSAQADEETSNELAAVLAASKEAGFEVRVAVIATKYDLGAVPVLYRKPQEYASFLGQELYYWYKKELLIVMPNGFGIYKNGPALPADRAALAALPPPGTTSPSRLVAAATRAVKTLAARRGIDLSDVRSSESPGSSTASDRIVIAIGAAAVLALGAGLVFLRRRQLSRQ